MNIHSYSLLTDSYKAVQNTAPQLLTLVVVTYKALGSSRLGQKANSITPLFKSMAWSENSLDWQNQS